MLTRAASELAETRWF